MSANPSNPTLGLTGNPASAPPGLPLPAARQTQPQGHEALQALLAFSSLHDQIKRSKAAAGETAGQSKGRQLEQFVLDEVLQMVAERALAITGSDGVAIALAEGDAIICRASAGGIAPDPRMRLNPKSGFSGTCFRTGRIVRCDDVETDARVNVEAARRLGVRSMVAVPLAGQHATIGLLEAFSKEAYGFQDGDVRTLNLLAELILAAMKPEEEDRLTEISQRVTGQTETVSPAKTPVVEEAIKALPVLDKAPQAGPAVLEEPAVESAPAVEVPAIEPSRLGLKIALGSLLLVLVVAGVVWLASRPSSRATSRPAPPVQAAVQPQAASPQTSSDIPEPAPTRTNGLALVSGVRHWSSPDSTTVVVDLQDQVQYEAHRLTDPERIYFDLHDTALPKGKLGQTIEVGDAWLARIRVAQPTQGVTRVVLETKGGPEFSVSLEQNPYRLMVVVRAPGATQPKAKVDLFAPVPQAPLPQVAASRPVMKPAPTAPEVQRSTRREVASATPKLRIALDAGHGGWDEGTVGRRGLMEKDLALDIVARLGKLIDQRLAAEVIYTRRDDTYIPLEKRTEIANAAGADLFVSIHANYSDLPSARGIETYYANTYSSVNARMPDSDASLKNVDWTNVDVQEKAQQSERLAVSVQNALYSRLSRENPDIRDRGVKKAGYIVLTGTMMPAILSEVSFVSSPEDEKSLKNSAYRQQIAEALYKGIARYAATSRKVTMASASGKPAGN